jgi:hypothetical protein
VLDRWPDQFALVLGLLGNVNGEIILLLHAIGARQGRRQGNATIGLQEVGA